MKIAIASSGLGHVARGIETWAMDVAAALAEQGVDVTLFAGADVSRFTLHHSRFTIHDSRSVKVLHCLKRGDSKAQRLSALMPGFAWRWGLKSAYGWEQFTFWLRLWPCLRQGGFDILHVQDPMLAYWCRKFRKLGLVKTKEILAHGTEEPIEFLEQFDYVQHLAPWHLEEARKKLKRTEK